MARVGWSAAALALLALSAGPASGETLSLRFAPGRFASQAEAEAFLRQTLKGAEAEIVALDAAAGSAALEGGRAAWARLSASRDILELRRAIAPAPRGFARFRVSLAPAKADGAATAAIERIGAAAAPAEGEAGGEVARGSILVVARDKSGAELSRQRLPDPRLVRYEAIDETGAFTARRDFLRTDVPAVFEVVLAEMEEGRVELLAAPAEDGQAARLLATAEFSTR